MPKIKVILSAAGILLLAFGLAWHFGLIEASSEVQTERQAGAPEGDPAAPATESGGGDSRSGEAARQPSYASAGNAQDWLREIPLESRQFAADFVSRYPDAYSFTSEEQQQWMVAHGFPTLEEIAAFGREPIPCPLSRCSNAKIAALTADQIISSVEDHVAHFSSDSQSPTNPQALPESARVELAKMKAEALSYVDRARDNGSVLFAAYLYERLSAATGDQIGAMEARAFLAACGDQRITDADNMVVSMMQAAIGRSEGGTRNCGYRPGRPTFP